MLLPLAYDLISLPSGETAWLDWHQFPEGDGSGKEIGLLIKELKQTNS